MTRVYNVVSPHLDDAALSCSLLLAANPGSYVTTVFAAGPPSIRPLTRWDRGAKYFTEGADVTGVRRGEDISATALVRATPIHLSYWDRQYRNERYGYQGLADEELPGAIAATLASRRPPASVTAWVIPLGLGHPDHRLVAEAGLILASREPGDVFLYEELPYAAEDVSEVAARKRYFAERGFELEDDVTVGIAADRALKAAVLRCHASQRRALRRRIRVATRNPERVWKIVRRQERCRGGVIAEGEATPDYRPRASGTPRVLHVVVGHGLAGYFLNAVRSVRAAAPDDPVLIVDNASPDRELLSELRRMADGDGLIDVIFRTENDVRQNRKVGSLYAAYEAAFDHAMARQADFLHLIQGDFQTLWWDSDVVARSAEIFAAHPRCVNLFMRANSRDMMLGDDFADTPGPDGLRTLRWYGLTDTGLYHLGRWRAWDMRFGPTEREHSRRYLDEGLEVVCHPWPTDVPIPWPAVVRNGIQRGREIVTGKPFLIRPLPAADVGRLKTGPDVWLEDICVPWGWVCATPIWGSDLDSIDYWVRRYRDARKNGIRHLFPRFELRGIDAPGRRKLIRRHQYRPSLFRLFVVCPVRYAVRSLMHFQRTLSILLGDTHGGMCVRGRIRQLRCDRL